MHQSVFRSLAVLLFCVSFAQAADSRPINYMSIYPTLNDLCQLSDVKNPKGQQHEGVSMRMLLADPNAKWARPALTTYGRNNHSLRSQNYRYIRYADGSEELYDHRSDPMEFTNLANDPNMAKIKKEFAPWLPKKNVPEAPRLKKRKK